MKLFRKLAVFALSALPIFALDSGLLQYGGSNVKDVAGVYVSRVMASPLGLFALSKIGPDHPEFLRFVTETGFDPRRDITELLVFGEGGKGKKPGMVVARGHFDVARLGAGLLGQGWKKTAYAGFDTYEARGGMVVFPESGIGIVGDPAFVKAALDRRGAESVLDPALASKIQAASQKDIWFLASGQGNIGLGKVRLPEGALEMVSGGLQLGSIVELTAEAVMKTEKDAQALAQLVQFLTAMGPLQGGQAPPNPLFSLLQNAKSSVQGNTVLLSLSAAQADLEKLLVAPNRRAAARPAK